METNIIPVFGFALVFVSIGVFAWAAVISFRNFQASSVKRIENLQAKYHIDTPCEDMRYAIIDYYVYWGFLNTLTTVRIIWRVSESDSFQCLNELLRFNLTHGVFGAGAFFVPFSSIFSYWRQRTKLKKKN